MTYDVLVAGGSVSGAALAVALSRAGARVLVVEREIAFRDRVRGEGIHPWGVRELKRLGLDDVLRSDCVREASYWDTHVGGTLVDRRPLAESSLARQPGMNAHHPELQETLLAAAASAGAEVRRGAQVESVEPGGTVTVHVETEGRRQTLEASVVVIADGRRSRLRGALGVASCAHASPMRVSGLLTQGMRPAEDAVSVFIPPGFGCITLVFPLPGGRARIYVASHSKTSVPLFSGADDSAAFFEQCAANGAPREWLWAAKPAGPLATFRTACTFAESAASPDGFAFIGDAAGDVDPALGCGLSLAFRDARCLAEHLGGAADRSTALTRYAEERRAYYGSLSRIESWVLRILYTPGPEGDALRARLPRLRELGVDIVGAGPDGPAGDETERRLFGD